MFKFLAQPRPKNESAPQAAPETGKIPSLGKRAAVVAASCALLIGVGAAGQATESSIRVAATETQAAEAQSNLSIEKSEITAKPAPEPAAPEIAVAPQAAEPAPAPKRAPAPAPAPKPAPAPAPKPAPAPAPKPAPKPAPVVAVNDPAGAQAYAAGQLAKYGWAPDQMQCLKTLWTKESDWTTTATNPSSGAYGIVQSLPAEKMASAGADYRTNYRTQINWGLNYIQERYQSPCGALNFHLSNNWY
ncbi:aggregation-promoting factor C-terminal-like domain-containing protein [Arthrobacter sp. Z4-13]|jgi:type V secretory pathway adhesin AidA